MAKRGGKFFKEMADRPSHDDVTPFHPFHGGEKDSSIRDRKER